MQLLKRLGGIFGFNTGIRSSYYSPFDAQKAALKAVDEYTIFPGGKGNYMSHTYYRMLKEDSHLAGLYRRIIFAILAAKVHISCEDEEVQKVVYSQMGYDAKQPSIKFIRLLNELVSSIQYGFSCHQKRIENNPITKQTDLKLRWIQPTDVHEFGVSYDDLISVAETYNKSIHGIRPTRKVDGETIEVVDIPVEEILHMAPLQMGYNYWGESFLEPALSDWVLKRVYRFANAILQGRFAVPIPWAQTETRHQENANVIAGQFQLPATDPNRLLVTDTDTTLNLLSPSNTTDIIASIGYHDFSMSKLLLEQFVDVGDKKYGSRGITEDSTDDFHGSLNFIELSIVSSITEIANEIASLNFSDPPPIKVLWEDLEFRGRRALIRLYNELAEKGTITKLVEDELYIREAMGLPLIPAEELLKVKDFSSPNTKTDPEEETKEDRDDDRERARLLDED